MTTTASDFSRSGYLNGGTYARRVRALVAHFLTCLDVAQQRRELVTLDDRALRDIGVRRLDAAQEARRGFWDIPA